MKGELGKDFIEKVDDKERGFSCMKLIKFLWEDNVTDIDEWQRIHQEARKGDCPYHSRCSIYKRTVKDHPPKQLELNLLRK